MARLLPHEKHPQSSENRASIRRMTQVTLLSALALVLSYLETMVPLPIAVPGVKLGLGNVAVVVALFLLDIRGAGAVALAKVVASGMLFGSPVMLIYSLAGTVCAFAGMVVLRCVPGIGPVPVSMVAAVLHNVGQIGVAVLMLSSSAVVLVLPPLAVAALVTGGLTGVVAAGVLAVACPEGNFRPSIDTSSLRVMPGEHVAFVGVNGSGKTSCALQLAGLSSEPTGRAEGIVGVAFQDPDDQIVASCVRDDVAFGPENLTIPQDKLAIIVEKALTEAGISCLGEREVSSLSGGQKQRVVLAGLLALRPGLVIFDEATAMLDPCARRAFGRVVKRLTGQGIAVITITQIMDEAFQADRIVLFSEGQIVALRTPCGLIEDVALVERCGLELPRVARLAADLRARGIPVSLTNDEDTLEEDLCRWYAQMLA